jgi:PBP1b-binding outer membrane lipoprotein LpoB
MRRLFSLFGIALALAGCADPYAEVRPKKPSLTGPPGSGPLVDTE